MGQYMAPIIMILITMATVLLLLFPIRFRFGSDLVKFYWTGFWCLLALIALVAGTGEVLNIVGYPLENLIIALLSGLMTSYVLFVVFAWFRLVAFGLFFGLRKINRMS